MNITTLQERIAKAEEKINKKENTIVKYHKTVEKKHAELKKLTGNENFTKDDYWAFRQLGNESDWLHEAYWVLCDIEHAEEGIENNTKQIAETRKTIEKYQKQLEGEIEREAVLATEIPESMKRMQEELAKGWDAWDKARRNALIAEYKEIGYKAFTAKHTYADYQFRLQSDEDIHKANMRDAKALVLNLYNRVKEHTGEVVDWSGIELTYGSHGCPALNGIVRGKEGNAEVESITAGGYNIQRLHVRVLVKKW